MWTADPEPHMLGEGTWEGAARGDAVGEATANTASGPGSQTVLTSALVNLASAGNISLLRWRPGGLNRTDPLPP